MEDVYTTEGKITPITNFSSMETTGSKLPTNSIISGICKLGQHLHLIHACFTHSDPTTEDRALFQWYVTFKQMHQDKPLTLIGDTLSWLSWIATTKDVRVIMRRVNQLIEAQTQQQETLVHVILILNITTYTTQINRQHINAVMQQLRGHTMMSPHSSTSPVHYISA